MKAIVLACLVNLISAVKIEGVPVFVNPKLLPNTAENMDLRQRDYVIDGVNGYEFVQLEDNIEDDTITLQVNGVPVTVNPESMMFKDSDNQMAATALGFPIRMGPDDLKLHQKSKPNDSVVLQVNGSPVEINNVQIGNPVNNPPFNNWSVNQPSVPHDKGLRGTEDLEQRDIIIDGVNNPPFNNWSVNQPSVPHDK